MAIKDEKIDALLELSDYQGLNLVAIRKAASNTYIGLRKAEKFATRTIIKKKIGEGKIRLKECDRKRQNSSYYCNLWDVLKCATL